MSITASIPLIPGKGVGNHIRLIKEVDALLVANQFRNFIIKNQAALGIDVKQMGPVKATKVTDRLWQISIPQQVNGVPVRWSRYVAVINSGNIILQGAATWGNVKIDTNPKINAQQALDLGFQYAGGKLSQDLIWKQPSLEIIPISPKNFAIESFAGSVGSGYGHRLAWVFGFQRAPENPRWEVVVDAHTSEVLAFEDKNHYIDKQIKGGAYPLTNTEICPDNIRCGILQPGTPMPFADTGFTPPNDFTNSAGVFDYSGGTTSTTLNGPYVEMTDTCGNISATGPGDIDMGGANGDHDCDTPTSGGNTAATRSGMYEVNKIFEEARGYLPNNQWLQGNDPGPLQTNMNIFDICNAFYDGSSINF
ncbi:endopeptidase, partial [bacterium]|nr:endopeptidase [bacterium]